MKKPNVLFIVTDQWRGDCFSFLKHPVVKTPNIDKLAEDSTVFLNHYSQATPCSPSRASIYTGMYQCNHRVIFNGSPLDHRHTNIALEARKAGYMPALIGYTDTAHDPRMFDSNDPILKTYEEYLPGIVPVVRVPFENPNEWLAWLKKQKVEIDYAQPESIYDPVGKAKHGIIGALPKFNNEQTIAKYLTDETQSYIDMNSLKSWFVHLSILTPHPPFIVPEPFNSMYNPKSEIHGFISAPDKAAEIENNPIFSMYKDFLDNPSNAHHFSRELKNLKDLTDGDYRCIRSIYYALISETDEKIGRLLQYLKDQNLYDNTLIIFTSDHGEQAGDHFLFGKFGYYDQSYHIPLMIKPPQNNKIRQISGFTEAIDLFPTLSEFLGLPIPAQCDGYSLMPYLKGESPSKEKTAVYWEHNYGELLNGETAIKYDLTRNECQLNVVRDDQFKFVHINKICSLLFNIQEDPQEINNLANDTNYADIKFRYAQKMIEWRIKANEKTLTGYLNKED